MYATILLFTLLHSSVGIDNEVDITDQVERFDSVVNKCCENEELVVDTVCRLSNNYNQSVWEPHFKSEDGRDAIVKHFHFINGYPDCATTQHREVYDLKKSQDELNLLFNGQLQHIIHHEVTSDSIKEEPVQLNTFSLHGPIPLPDAKEPESYTHQKHKYCLDKVLITATNETGLYAIVCIPEVKINWRETSFILKKVLNPLFHAVSMILFLIVAIIYFVLPTLRDLAGNIITTINMCLIVSQAANLVKIFTELGHHISFMVADIILCGSLLSAFFWLTSFGFYIWKTFKSRNVFLRVTDVRKYCYYSSVVWSCVLLMASLALCAHFLLDTGMYRIQKSASYDDEQESFGLLGTTVFFVSVAFTFIFNLFFYVTTLNVIKRLNIYGRIHHKLKGCFDLFLQLFLIMTTAWLFLLLSWLKFEELIYAHVFVNLLQGVLVFYVCILRQPHVIFLLRKSCCYAVPVPTADWGEEMSHMNGGNY